MKASPESPFMLVPNWRLQVMIAVPVLCQWLQWLQLGVTFSQVVWLIGC